LKSVGYQLGDHSQRLIDDGVVSGITLAPSYKPKIAQRAYVTTEFLQRQDVPHSLLNLVSSLRSLIRQFPALH